MVEYKNYMKLNVEMLVVKALDSALEYVQNYPISDIWFYDICEKYCIDDDYLSNDNDDKIIDMSNICTELLKNIGLSMFDNEYIFDVCYNNIEICENICNNIEW